MNSTIQAILIFIVTFVAAIDQFNFLESLYQPIVMGPIVGAIMGDMETGLVVGATYQLMSIGNMPVGGAQPPNPVIGGIMATVLAISLQLQDPLVAIGLAIPFALLGQFTITTLFTFVSPVMRVADKHAENANVKGIERLNYATMALLGTIFGLIVVSFFVAGKEVGKALADAIPPQLSAGLSAAGGMMRFVGFAILLKVMMSKELWGFYAAGFALATLFNGIKELQSPALLLLALIGFALAYWDFQLHVKLGERSVVASHGGEEDGI